MIPLRLSELAPRLRDQPEVARTVPSLLLDEFQADDDAGPCASGGSWPGFSAGPADFRTDPFHLPFL